MRLLSLLLLAVFCFSSCRKDSTEPGSKVSQPLFQSTPPMGSARHSHAATLLKDGRVLVTGGMDDAQATLATAELFDPVGNTWAPAKPMAIKRRNHRAVVLDDGSVLVIGGANTASSLPSAERYNPITNSWTSAGSMILARTLLTATLLPNGKVLVAGGYASQGSAELYNPATNVWTSAGMTAVPRFSASATLLANGKVLLAGGGQPATPLASSELYDPTTNSWTTTASMQTGRSDQVALLLPNGNVLVVGGRSVGPTPLSSCEQYDPVTNTWNASAPMVTARYGHAGAQLIGDKFLIAGGNGPLTSTELYDATANSWTFGAPLAIGRTLHTATRLQSGDVLIAGGEQQSSLPWVELYQPAIGGTACTTAATCPSGFCVDGLCCDTACTGACNACDLPGSPGVCTVNPAGNTGNPSCKPYTCTGASASCGTTCSVDAECAVAHFCSAGVCTPMRTRGASCTAANQCSTAHCSDGLCCNTDCAGACDSCDSFGTCNISPAAIAPGNPSCAPYVCSGLPNCPLACTGDVNCVSSHACDGGSCVPRAPIGRPCTSPNQCASRQCADGVCCNAACFGACDSCVAPGSVGTCQMSASGSPGVPSCAPYLCSGIGANCPFSCSGDAGCASTYRCMGTYCALRDPNGRACSDDGQCVSGHCVDGVCCGSACDQPCEACTGDGGVCEPLASGSTGRTSCSPYLCQGLTSCPFDCTRDSQCVGTHFCSFGKCVARQVEGDTCDAGSNCASGFCSDGVCCNSKCGGGCDVCNAPGTVGTCKLLAAGDEGSPSCAPYLCPGNDGRCRGTCTMDAHCVSPNFCSGGFCTTNAVQPPKPSVAGCGCQTGGSAPWLALLLAMISFRAAATRRTALRARTRR